MREFFTKNPGLKIISLFLAIALWLFVVGEEKAEIGLTIPLEIMNVPENLIVSNDIIQDLNVRISGPRSMIRRLASERLSKSIDLKGVEPGKISFEILPEELPLPGGIKVTRLSPSSVVLNVEKIEQKKLNILPVLQGSPKIGYEVVSVKFSPNAILVHGPSSALTSLDVVWTKPINVEKKSESFQQQITLDITDNQIALVNKDPIQVEVIIDQKVITRLIKDVQVKGLNSPYLYEMDPVKVNVQLMGPEVKFTAFDTNRNVDAFVDLGGLPPGKYARKASVNVPKGLTLLDITPSIVEVKIIGPEKGE